jgi:hypothetical protein
VVRQCDMTVVRFRPMPMADRRWLQESAADTSVTVSMTADSGHRTPDPAHLLETWTFVIAGAWEIRLESQLHPVLQPATTYSVTLSVNSPGSAAFWQPTVDGTFQYFATLWPEYNDPSWRSEGQRKRRRCDGAPLTSYADPSSPPPGAGTAACTGMVRPRRFGVTSRRPAA